MSGEKRSEYLLGLVGHPLSHSLSPPMHRAALAHCGLSGDYVLVDVEEAGLAERVSRLAEEGFAGFNVTVPHKVGIKELAAELSPEATSTGAVNTVKVREDGRLEGHNTDVPGFVEALNAVLPANAVRRSACVVGAGGAARAALRGLLLMGWPEIVVVARNGDRAAELAEEFSRRADGGDLLPAAKITASDTSLARMRCVPDVVVNSTTVGMSHHEPPEWVETLLNWMDPQGTFFDMVYAPTGGETAMVRLARRLRLNCTDGADMLVRQAALSFHLWTGVSGVLDVMRQVLERERRKRASVAQLEYGVLE